MVFQGFSRSCRPVAYHIQFDDTDAVVLIIRIKRKPGPETYANIHVEE